MKIVFFLIIFIFSLVTANAQSWIQRGGGSTVDEGMSIAADASGNTYTTGYFTTTAIFDNNSTVSSAGLDDIFIVKTDSVGTLKWLKRAGGLNIDKANAIAADSSGNILITGFYYGTADFDGQQITAVGLQDVFIAKYNSAGTLIWLKSIGGIGSDIGNAVTFDNSGNVIVTGEFSGTCSFGASTSLVSLAGSIDVFTAKYDSNGNLLWAKKGSGSATDRGTGVSADALGNIYVCGMFSDTITFDVQHNNPMYNSMFVIKYNSSGTEQWFRWMGSGTNVNIGGIKVFNNDINITGNFNSTLYFFGFTGNPTLSSLFNNNIFVCRFDLSGNLVWSHADGSLSEVTASSINTKNNGEVITGGNFKCRMSDFSSHYGAGIFCSIGNWDTYVASYDNSGNWLWARQFGGRQNDYLKGLAVLPNNKIVETGSYEDGFYSTISQATFLAKGNANDYNFISSGNSGYCSDLNYSSFINYVSYGSSDIIINADIDLSREPYDYFKRYGTNCSRPFNDICIGSSLANLSCVDTVSNCGATWLGVDLNMMNNLGPDFNYLWNNGSTGSSLNVTSSGYYSVSVTSADGCFSNRDTVYYLSYPVPPAPLISDSKGVNTNSTTPQPITFCLPDSVLLTCTNAGTNTVQWLGFPQGQTAVNINTGGSYYCYLTNQYGCVNQNSVDVITGSTLQTVQPIMTCPTDSDHNDTITLCLGDVFEMYLYDQLSNPGGAILNCFPGMSKADWDTIGTLTYDHVSYCDPNSNNYFTPKFSGTFNYTISTWIVRINPCDTDSVFCTKSIVVIVHPVPTGNISLTITGPSQLCPGDTTMLIASPDTLSLNWSTGDITDTVFVTQPGSYYVSSTHILTNNFGCSAVINGTASITISSYPQPNITLLPGNGLICPNDSVQLICSGTGNVNWQGPNGTININANNIYANTAGYYYAVQTVGTGCYMVSNTVQIIQYNTPAIITFPEPAICFGNPVTLIVVAGAGSVIQWQSPFSGSNSSQIINSPGTYNCKVTSCGIATQLTATVNADSASAAINSLGLSTFCGGDSLQLTANAGMSGYEWLPYGETTQSIYADQPGIYSLTTTSTFGCKDTTSITITETPNLLTPPLVNDTLICAGKSVDINVLSSDTVYWSLKPNYTTTFFTGTTYQTPILINPVTYYLYTKSELCKSRFDSLSVLIDDNCNPVFIPNVFSPNGDGVNDLFPALPDINNIDIKIFNRWGALVFEGNQKSEGWNGRDENEKIVPDGTYYYIIHAGFYNGQSLIYKGFVTVIK